MPETADWNTRLRAWYAADPGVVHALTRKYKTDAGCNTYELVARELDDVENPNPTVVDVGCGGGDLYRYGKERLGNGYWVGIDYVPEQVAAARRAFPGVDFRCEPAQATSLEDGAVDAVLMHGVLGEVTPIDGLINEVARVLRPGGVFVATAQGGGEDRGDAWPGDLRARSSEGIASLFDDRFEEPRIQHHTFIVKDTPDALRELLARCSPQFITDSDREQDAKLDKAIAAISADSDEPDRPSIEVPVLLVTVKRR